MTKTRESGDQDQTDLTEKNPESVQSQAETRPSVSESETSLRPLKSGLEVSLGSKNSLEYYNTTASHLASRQRTREGQTHAISALA